jgi:hypothetical protein
VDPIDVVEVEPVGGARPDAVGVVEVGVVGRRADSDGRVLFGEAEMEGRVAPRAQSLLKAMDDTTTPPPSTGRSRRPIAREEEPSC